MPDAFFGADHEAGGFFAGEGAEGFEVAAGAFEFEIAADDVFDVESGFDFVAGVLHS